MPADGLPEGLSSSPFARVEARLDALDNYERHPPKPGGLGLAHTIEILRRLGDPHRKVPAIHVAGTKGKGSTATVLASMLRSAGSRTGLYLSPHVLDVRERIQVDGQPAPDGDLARAFDAVWEAAGDKALRADGPTYFEVLTAMAFWLFADLALDAAVIEVGLGGRLDATNVVLPVVSVITRIDLEHTAILGNDVRSIAREKAGIIKPGVPVVTSAAGEAADEIAAIARERGSPLYRLGEAFSYRVHEVSPLGTRFSARTWRSSYARVATSLVGRHQAENGTVALAALDAAADAIPSGRRARVEGLRRASIPARCQVLSAPRAAIVDGAHTRDSAACLASVFRDVFGRRRAVLVFGAAHDKDIAGMADVLHPLARRIVATAIPSPRSAPPEEVGDIFRRAVDGTPVEVVPSPENALESALAGCGPDDVLVVAGSLYLAGTALRHLETAGHAPLLSRCPF